MERYIGADVHAASVTLSVLGERPAAATRRRRDERPSAGRVSAADPRPPPSPHRPLETAPGLGPVRTAQLLPIVITPWRFRTKRQFWAYCGFGIVTRSSSDYVFDRGRWVRARVTQTRGLNFNHNRVLKAIFKGAATSVIAHMGPNPLREGYDRMLANGTKPNLAKLTVARQIAAIVLAMWKSQEEYDPGRNRQAVAAS